MQHLITLQDSFSDPGPSKPDKKLTFLFFLFFSCSVKLDAKLICSSEVGSLCFVFTFFSWGAGEWGGGG